jgi:hypothetical protein
MSGNWRISTFNGALLAAYFIPVWTITAFRIVLSPIHGLYERPNISLALFVSDHLQLSGIATVRVALLLALGRMTVVAFLAVFLVFITRASIRKAGGCDEALGMALLIGRRDEFCRRGDGLAGRRDGRASAARGRVPDDARHGHCHADRAARAAAGRRSFTRRTPRGLFGSIGLMAVPLFRIML